MLCRRDLHFWSMLANSFTLQPLLGWEPAYISGLQGQENPRLWECHANPAEFSAVLGWCVFMGRTEDLWRSESIFSPPATPNQCVFMVFFVCLFVLKMEEDKLMLSFRFYRPNSTAQKYLQIIPHRVNPKIVLFYCGHFVLFCFGTVITIKFYHPCNCSYTLL